MEPGWSKSGLNRAHRPLLALLAAVVVVGAGMGGCTSAHRERLTEEQLEARRAIDDREAVESFSKGITELVARTVREQDDYAAGRSTVPPQLDILALSGGGDWGAFGAGFLVGWGKTTDGGARPDFDAVTGVSTGALLAPFAYVGTDEACAFVENFYRNPKKDWAATRSFLFFLPHYRSFMVIPGLERDIRAALTPEFVGQVAAGREAGRLLGISATNLDLAQQRVWLLGEEAQRARETGDSDHMCKILLASAAIPAAFPPVEINGFLYTDGGVTANVLLRLDPDAPNSFLNVWKRTYPDRPIPKVRYWILVNNQLRPPPVSVKLRWPAIMVPALNTSTRSATMAEIRWLAAQAALVNTTWNTDIEIRLASIPADWHPPVEGSFKKETMRSLCDLGRVCGANPDSWTLLVSRDTRRAIPLGTPADPALPPDPAAGDGSR